MVTDIEDIYGARSTDLFDLGSDMEDEQPSSFVAKSHDDDNINSYIARAKTLHCQMH